MTQSIISPLQLTALDSLLQNQGVAVNGNLNAAVTQYNSTPLIAPLLGTITVGATGNILFSAVITELQSLGNSTCPALGDSTPAAYSGVLPQSTTSPGFLNSVSTFGSTEAGAGDVSKYVQAFYAAQSYVQQTNDIINSAVNANTYLAGTFTNTNDQITGFITAITGNISAFSGDLAKLGNLIDLNNLNNWGSPGALFQQIARVAGGIPAIGATLVANGVDAVVVAELINPRATFTDTVQKQLYNAMKFVTGDELTQILTVLNVTTPGITTMADLLEVSKIFPTSYTYLTVPVAAGLANIFVANTTSVNSTLAEQLPSYVLSSVL